MQKICRIEKRVCPKCGLVFNEPPALSRTDDFTYICPDCGTREALQYMGVSEVEQEKILATIHSRTL